MFNTDRRTPIMKTAYCFSGHLRRFWDNPTLVRHIIDRAPGDIFVHTWDTLSPGPSSARDKGLSSVPVDGRIVQELTRRYGKPAGLEVEHPPELPPHLMPALQARYSAWRANEIKTAYESEFGFRYDRVVSLRFDLVAHDAFDFPPIEAGVLYCLGTRTSVAQGLCSDLLNFGSADTMDAVSELYLAMRDGAIAEPDADADRLLTRWCAERQMAFQHVTTRCSMLRADGSLLPIP